MRYTQVSREVGHRKILYKYTVPIVYPININTTAQQHNQSDNSIITKHTDNNFT